MTDKLDLGAVSLAYETFGSGDPPLLLVHGYTGSKLDWTDVVAPLSVSRRVVTFDHRGHGESTNTGDPDSYTLDALMADLTGFVEGTIGDARFDLVGHSMGGVLAMRYALDQPARVRSLVLMDSFSEPNGLLPEAFRTSIARIGREQGMGAVAALIRPFVAASGNLEPVRAAEIGDRLAWKFEHLDVEAFVALADELSSFPSLTARLAEISSPTTVVVGENDALRPAADVLAANVPGAALCVIPNAAHSPQEENTVAWLAAIERHLEAVE
jgi:pimeloyl-ACP methyl ester carboxylesterase